MVPLNEDREVQRAGVRFRKAVFGGADETSKWRSPVGNRSLKHLEMWI